MGRPLTLTGLPGSSRGPAPSGPTCFSLHLEYRICCARSPGHEPSATPVQQEPLPYLATACDPGPPCHCRRRPATPAHPPAAGCGPPTRVCPLERDISDLGCPGSGFQDKLCLTPPRRGAGVGFGPWVLTAHQLTWEVGDTNLGGGGSPRPSLILLSEP